MNDEHQQRARARTAMAELGMKHCVILREGENVTFHYCRDDEALARFRERKSSTRGSRNKTEEMISS